MGSHCFSRSASNVVNIGATAPVGELISLMDQATLADACAYCAAIFRYAASSSRPM